MVHKTINDIAGDVSILERCNGKLYDYWNDNNSAAFKSAISDNISNNSKSYLSEAELLSRELNRLREELEQDRIRLQKIMDEIHTICHFPEIRGCQVCRAVGHEVKGGPQCMHHFVLTKNETYLINDKEALRTMAPVMCPGLKDIKEVTHVANLG